MIRHLHAGSTAIQPRLRPGPARPVQRRARGRRDDLLRCELGPGAALARHRPRCSPRPTSSSPTSARRRSSRGRDDPLEAARELVRRARSRSGRDAEAGPLTWRSSSAPSGGARRARPRGPATAGARGRGRRLDRCRRRVRRRLHLRAARRPPARRSASRSRWRAARSPRVRSAASTARRRSRRPRRCCLSGVAPRASAAMPTPSRRRSFESSIDLGMKGPGTASVDPDLFDDPCSSMPERHVRRRPGSRFDRNSRSRQRDAVLRPPRARPPSVRGGPARSRQVAAARAGHERRLPRPLDRLELLLDREDAESCRATRARRGCTS